MAQIPVTRVRYSENEARKLLESYVFASRSGSMRPPRGIPPELVASFLCSALNPDSPALCCERALEAMRFYELKSLSPHLKTLLTGREQSYADVRRSAFLLQGLADLGNGGDAEWAANYFDRVLLQKNGFAEAADLLLETLLSLAPFGSVTAFVERLRAGIAASRDPQLSGNLREIEDNRLRGMAYLSAGKIRIMDTPPEHRSRELISIYLLRSDLSQPYLVTWAARTIRSDASIAGTPIHADLGRVLDSAEAARRRNSDTTFMIVRAAQAIVYLQGELTPGWHKLYDSSHPGSVSSFLCDD